MLRVGRRRGEEGRRRHPSTPEPSRRGRVPQGAAASTRHCQQVLVGAGRCSAPPSATFGMRRCCRGGAVPHGTHRPPQGASAPCRPRSPPVGFAARCPLCLSSALRVPLGEEGIYKSHLSTPARGAPKFLPRNGEERCQRLRPPPGLVFLCLS